MLFHLFPVESNAGVGIDAEVSRNSVKQGDEITFRAGITGSWDQAVDVYLALLKPLDSSIYYLGPDLKLTTKRTALLRGWVPFAIANVDLYHYAVSKNDIDGDYFWCGVLTYAGRDLFGVDSVLPGAVSVAQFSKTDSAYDPDAGVVDWLPREGTVFHTTEPEVFLEFSKPVDRDSVEKRIAVTIKSLSSGKIVSVKHDEEDGERWATAVIPDFGTVSQKIEENEFISHGWSEDDTRIVYQIESFTVYGQTFALHHGVTYQLTFQLMKGAMFADGNSIPEKNLGPITFSID